MPSEYLALLDDDDESVEDYWVPGYSLQTFTLEGQTDQDQVHTLPLGRTFTEN